MQLLSHFSDLYPEIQGFVGYRFSILRKNTYVIAEYKILATDSVSLYMGYMHFCKIKYNRLIFAKCSLHNPESQVI